MRHFSISAVSDTRLTADYGGSRWDDGDPSVSSRHIFVDEAPRGEYLWPGKVPQVMQDHWNSYVTEDDNFLSSNGINAVRIPVGWWIAQDPTPSKPSVGGSLKALDNAFTWAQISEDFQKHS
ncbi:Glucan 1,3-beta-glucosidase [Melia azedarach]|uniref:Glucan 1,3-beta-glucosidase n=1 Tax=Melia azedarach TaxID=155640 RepID=A0ACC1XY76_MELAZ|nr:Glucan 1,3-beta-glucosidase [Melia azedarach]